MLIYVYLTDIHLKLTIATKQISRIQHCIEKVCTIGLISDLTPIVATVVL